MKTQFLALITAVVTAALVLSCKEEVPITYEDALHNCKMDTMVLYGKNDTTKIPYVPETCVLGSQLPMFASKLMDGKDVNADYFDGKIIVINFWFIGCHPCEEEMPGFNALIEKYKGQPVKFLAISRNTPADITEFMATHPFNADQVALGESITNDIYHMQWGYPHTIVADEHQRIIYTGGLRGPGKPEQLIQDALIPVIDGALKKM